MFVKLANCKDICAMYIDGNRFHSKETTQKMTERNLNHIYRWDLLNLLSYEVHSEAMYRMGEENIDILLRRAVKDLIKCNHVDYSLDYYEQLEAQYA